MLKTGLYPKVDKNLFLMDARKSKVTYFILVGMRKKLSLPATWVHNTRECLVLDLIDKLRSIDLIDRIVVSSTREQFLDKIGGSDDRVIADHFRVNNKFHFGQWLVRMVKKYRPHNLFYWGGGASPLITREIIESLSASIISGKDILYTNNFFSSDWVVFTPARACLKITPPPLDNNLAYYLWKEAGLRSIYIDPSVEIVGDVDTPADLLVLSKLPGAGRKTQKYLNSLPLNTSRVEKFTELLKNRSRIFLYGRVGSSLFKYLDKRSPCSFRIISEERGMRAFGRVARGEVRSILGFMFDQMGIDKTFDFIESLADAAVMDSRVTFYHLRKYVSTPDRFYSDLGLYENIEDPWVRDFTQRVVESSIPILTGGHSLILGGLWGLVSAYGETPWFY